MTIEKLEQRLVSVTLNGGPHSSLRPVQLLMLVDVVAPDTSREREAAMREMDRAEADTEDAAKKAIRPYLNSHAYMVFDQMVTAIEPAPRSRREIDDDVDPENYGDE